MRQQDAAAAPRASGRQDRMPVAGQHMGQPDQTEWTSWVRGQQAVRIPREVGVEFPNRPRPVGSGFRQQPVDRVVGDRRDISL